MNVPHRYILHQAPAIAAIGRTVLSALYQRAAGPRGKHAPAVAVPGPEIHQTLKPRSRDLVRCYIEHIGGAPLAYAGALPPHLFPQWGLPLAAPVFAGLDYPMARVINARCRLDLHAPLPDDEPLEVRGRLESIDDDGRRALVQTRIVTGTRSAPDAIEGRVTVRFPSGETRQERGRAQEGACARSRRGRDGVQLGLRPGRRPRVRQAHRRLQPHPLGPGLRARLRLSGCILHGFAILAYAMEGLQMNTLGGDTARLRAIEVSFLRPLLLPARVGLYRAGDAIFVGDGPGEPAYLTGTFQA